MVRFDVHSPRLGVELSFATLVCTSIFQTIDLKIFLHNSVRIETLRVDLDIMSPLYVLKIIKSQICTIRQVWRFLRFAASPALSHCNEL